MACLTYEQVLKQNTGYKCDNVEEMNDKRVRLSDATRKMADRLEMQGIQAFDAGQIMTEVGDVSGEVSQTMGRYRNLMLLPEVAKRVRSETIRQLSYFIQNHPQGRYFRYLVATSGERVPLSDEGALRERRAKLTRNFSRWVYDAKERFGVRVLCRSDEYTFNADGAHYHTNCIYYPTRLLSREEWQEFLDFTRSRLGNVWVHDAGILRDVRECIKYICKLSGDGKPDKEGAESWGADELSSDELGCLHRETYRQKHFQPVGEFADWLRDNDDKKIVNLRERDGSVSLRLMEKPKRSRTNKKPLASGGRAENVIVHRTLPQPSKDGVFEPKTLVLGYTENPSTLCGKSGLHLIQSNQEQAREWARVNQARASFIVHNSTPTVQNPEPEKLIKPNRTLAMRRYLREKQRKQEASKPKQRQKPRRPKILTPRQVASLSDFPGDWESDDPRWVSYG